MDSNSCALVQSNIMTGVAGCLLGRQPYGAFFVLQAWSPAKFTEKLSPMNNGPRQNSRTESSDTHTHCAGEDHSWLQQTAERLTWQGFVWLPFYLWEQGSMRLWVLL